MLSKISNLACLVVTLLFTCALFTDDAVAQTYAYSYQYGQATSGTVRVSPFDSQIKDITSFRSVYDATTQTITIDAIVNPTPDTTTQNPNDFIPSTGFWIGIQPNGESPENQRSGEVAAIYFDYSKPSDSSYPRVSVYGMTGQYVNQQGTYCDSGEDCRDDRSWLDGSTLNNLQSAERVLPYSNAAVSEKSAVTDANLVVTYHLKISTSAINGYQRLNAAAHRNDIQNPQPDWEGTQFGRMVGVYFRPTCRLSTTYTPQNFLSGWDRCYQGLFEACDQTTNTYPACASGSSNRTTVEAGNALTASATVFDEDSAQVTVNYTALPSGMQASVANGSVNAVGADGRFTVNYNWTPSASDIGTYSINTTFVDSSENAAVQGSSVCPLVVEVVAPSPKDCAGTVKGKAVVDRCGVCGGDGNSCLGCTSQDATPMLLALDGVAQDMRRLNKRAAAIILKGRSAADKKAAKAQLITSEKGFVTAWTTLWTKLPVTPLTCTNSTFCSSISFANEFAIYSKSVNEMVAVNRKLVAIIKKGKSTYSANDLKKSKAIAKDLKKLLADSTKINAAAPISSSTCS